MRLAHHFFFFLIIVWFGQHQLLAHSEPDKALYVAIEGTDIGDCANPLRPCKTIEYAVSRAKKGDHIRVASGEYRINNLSELYYFNSDIVPIFGGYNRFDHFQQQSPATNLTRLSGVPYELVEAVRQKGFNVISDGKSSTNDSLMRQIETLASLKQRNSNMPCTNGQAGAHPCSNIDLVSHVPLSAFSTSPGSGSDIWGHVDLNNGREYALMGTRNSIAVFDLADPANPQEVGSISGTSTTWRDIKVFQYYDDALATWRAYAYATADNVTEGVTIIDLNQLPARVALVERNTSVQEAHNVYISNIDHGLNIALDGVEPSLQLIGANRFGGSFHSYRLNQANTLSEAPNQTNYFGYTHDGASVNITSESGVRGCANNANGCTVFVDFNEREILFWDITDPAATTRLSQVTYEDVPTSAKYIHSGWVTDDQHYVLVHDEFDEDRAGLDTTVRIFQISDLDNPIQVGQWTGPTAAIDHNGFVRGNRYYMSTYERGLTVLDITDPTNPNEVGFFDTFPSSNNSSYNGAWGVYPYLPSGLILVSDINSGLYVLADRTRGSVQGELGFATQEVEYQRDQTVLLEVSRSNAANPSEAVTVGYQVLSGSAESGDDFILNSGELVWSANDTDLKNIELVINRDATGTQFSETLFIKLVNPTNGATLGQHNLLKVTLTGVPQGGAVEFTEGSLRLSEKVGSVSISIARNGGSEGAAIVGVRTVDNTAVAGEDYQALDTSLNWADGDNQAQLIEVTITDDTLSETNEQFYLELYDPSGAAVGTNGSINIALADDETNQPPSISTATDIEANVGQTVNLSVTVADSDGDALAINWEQLSGPSVSLSSQTGESVSFVAPSVATELTFRITVSDIHNSQSSVDITVTLVAPAESSSGSGDALMWMMLMLMVFCWRRS